MTAHEARLIRELKKRCTYRRLAEIFYAEGELGYGVQGYGEDLCKEALEVLYPRKGEAIWATSACGEDARFGIENKSAIGDFFWWE
jgi:hypothetical protein